MDQLLSVSDALSRVLAGAARLGEESAPLAQARGRTLAADLVARRTQPPVAVSAMDGYALRVADLTAPLRIVGESAAGSAYEAALKP
ncbi:MAG TPA: molybdopterin molybdenumtransferase MoeA, partial [Methylocystis sp.]